MLTSVLQARTSLIDKSRLADSLTWTWQEVVANPVTEIATLAALLSLDETALAQRATHNDFELRTPLPFVARMRSGDTSDPLLNQILPDIRENQNSDNCVSDPLNESQYNVRPGLVHKYKGRVLLTAAVSCPINCRYCFRRHFPYNENRIGPNSWQPAIDYINNDTSIREVILSGGEPLLLNDRTLARLLDAIETIKHIKLLRIHTRFPIAVPQRLSDSLCERLASSSCKVTMVLHTNHPNEIDTNVQQHLQPLVSSSVTLLNQSVLLRGINDNAKTLVELSEKLFDVGVLPYYLHATDPVTGTAHFQVPDSAAQQIAKQLTASLPGYLVPTLVREISGKSAKTRLPL